MLAFPELIVVASTASGLLAAKELLGLEPPTELVDWLKRWKTPAQAEAGLVSLPALPSCVVCLLPDALVSLSALAKHGEETQFLFLLESPERQLAQGLPPSGGLPAWVQTWVGRHRELLKQLQRLRPRGVAVDMDEWLAEPERLAGLCPALPALKMQQVSKVPAALTRLVAGAQLQGEAALLALGQELFDACSPLRPVASRPELALAQWQAARHAEDALPALQSRATELEGLSRSQAAQVEQLLQERQQARDEMAVLSQAKLDLEATLGVLKPQAAAMRDELQSLGKQLAVAEQAQAELAVLQPQAQALREELAQVVTQLGALEASVQQQQLTIAEGEAQQQALNTKLQALEIDLQAALNSCDALASERDALLALQQQREQEQQQLAQQQQREAEQQDLALRTARAEVTLLTGQVTQLRTEALPRLEQRLRDGQDELQLEREKAQRLLIDLHALQQELQDQHDATQTLLRLQGLDASAPACGLDTLSVELERDAPPHRELHLQLGALRLGDRYVEQLGLRLLEHGGHVGVAFYGDSEGGPLLSTWREDAREGERGLMLLLPEDEAGLQLLQRLPTSDWDRLQALIARLQYAIEQDPALRVTRWPAVTARLLQLIQSQAPRLRYDGLALAREGDGWQLRFLNTLFGRRRAAAMVLRLQPEGVGGLHLQAAPQLLLRAWPRDAQGQPLSELELPVGAAEASGGDWPEPDLALMQAVLDALPAAALQEPSLTESVARLQQDWARRRAPPVGRLRRLLRRLRGSR